MIGLVHLVRAANRLEPFRAFLDAYRSHPAHIDHELLLLFKGFRNRSQLQAYQALLHDTPYRALYLADVGFDIGPYAVAAQRFEHRYFCFLNSFSAPLADGWLASLYRQLLRPGVGLVGASGSWESAYTNVLAATV
ncbi:MAG: hypothetical protein H7Y32_00695, partial [Chloroflexales bacterium]|nr:hypothetical protein [Chloroflexales bacterium]